jgi:methionyl-tRNA synthetase
MIAKQCNAVLPGPGNEPAPFLPESLLPRVAEAMDDLALHRALEILWEGVGEANRYFADMAPWALRKTDPAKADAVLYWTAEAVRQLAIMVRWVIPASADKLLDQLGIATDARNLIALSVRLAAGAELPTPQGVFPRLEMPVEA